MGAALEMESACETCASDPSSASHVLTITHAYVCGCGTPACPNHPDAGPLGKRLRTDGVSGNQVGWMCKHQSG